MRSLNGPARPETPRRDPAAAAVRRDPAPSRAAYRLHRLWLTPLVRTMARVGLPAFVLTFSAGLYLSDDDRRAGLEATLTEVRRAFTERPEFMISTITVAGASDVVLSDIRAVLPEDLPKSSFDLDLDALRAAVEGVDAVAQADLRVVSGNTLALRIEERVPAVLWRGPVGLELWDATGHRIAGVSDRVDYPDLPLIAGEGAGEAVGEARALWAAAGPILPRVRGLVRMGARRWDVVLDRGQRILLPARAPVAALERAIALDQARDVLARDVVAVDLRNPARPTIRMTEAAARALQRMRAPEMEAVGQ